MKKQNLSSRICDISVCNREEKDRDSLEFKQTQKLKTVTFGTYNTKETKNEDNHMAQPKIVLNNKNNYQNEKNILQNSNISHISKNTDLMIPEFKITDNENQNDISVPNFIPQNFFELNKPRKSLNRTLKITDPYSNRTSQKYKELIIYKFPNEFGRVAQINTMDIIRRSLDLIFDDFTKGTFPKILKNTKTTYLLQKYQTKLEYRLLQIMDFCDTNNLLEKKIRKAKHHRSKLRGTLMKIRTNRISLSTKINSMRLYHINQISSLDDLRYLDKFFSTFSSPAQLSTSWFNHVRHILLLKKINLHLTYLNSLSTSSDRLKSFLNSKK